MAELFGGFSAKNHLNHRRGVGSQIQRLRRACITKASKVWWHMIFLHTGEYDVLLHLRCYGDTSFEVVGYGIQGHLSSFCTNCVQFSNSSRFPVKILRHHVSCYISDLQAPSNSYRHIASKVWGHMIFSRGGGVGVHNQSVVGRVGTNII